MCRRKSNWCLLLKLLLERGFIKRIAFITHDLPMLSNIADRIAVMYAGKLVEIGPTRQIVETRSILTPMR